MTKNIKAHVTTKQIQRISNLITQLPKVERLNLTPEALERLSDMVARRVWGVAKLGPRIFKAATSVFLGSRL